MHNAKVPYLHMCDSPDILCYTIYCYSNVNGSHILHTHALVPSLTSHLPTHHRVSSPSPTTGTMPASIACSIVTAPFEPPIANDDDDDDLDDDDEMGNIYDEPENDDDPYSLVLCQYYVLSLLYAYSRPSFPFIVDLFVFIIPYCFKEEFMGAYINTVISKNRPTLGNKPTPLFE